MDRICCICKKTISDDEKHFAFCANSCNPVKKKNGKFLVGTANYYGRFCASCFSEMSDGIRTDLVN